MTLDSVFFPSTVVCNMNSLRKSFLNEISKDPTLHDVNFHHLWRAIDNTFIQGKNTSKEDEELIQRILTSSAYHDLFNVRY